MTDPWAEFVYGPGAQESGRAGTPEQQAYASAMAPHLDRSALVGTPQRPSYDTPTAIGNDTIYHVDAQGRLHDPVATAQAKAGVKPAPGGDDEWADFTPGQTFDTRPVSQGLGAAQGTGVVAKNLADLFRPLFDPAIGLRNLANATVLKANPLPDINPVDVVGDLYGRKVADAAKTYRPGAEGKIATEAALTLPLAVAGEGAPLLTGAMQGALTSESDQPLDRLRDIGLGALGGKAGGMVGGATKSVIWPTIRPEAQWALDNGIRITPGGVAGGFAKGVEGAASKGTIAGPMIGRAQLRGVEDFNVATARHVLDGTGLELPEGVSAGHDAVNTTHNMLSGAFNALAPKLSLVRDAPLSTAAFEATNAGTLLPAAYRARMGALVDQLPVTGGPINGRTVQDLTAQLRQEAADGIQSGDFFGKDYGRAVDKLRAAVEDALERANPDQAQQLRGLRTAWAKQVRVERASRDAVQDGGVFTPKGLLSAVRASDQSARDNATARGEALLQDWANAGKAVLPDKLPTPGNLWTHFPELAVAYGVGKEAHTPGLVAMLGGEAALGSLYTTPAQKAVIAAMTQRPKFAEGAAELARKLTPLLSTTGAVGTDKIVLPALQAQAGGYPR